MSAIESVSLRIELVGIGMICVEVVLKGMAVRATL